MKIATILRVIYACIAMTVLYFSCAKDSLFDSQGHLYSSPYAFVSPDSISTSTSLVIGDSLGFASTYTAALGKQIYFVGLVSPAQKGIKTVWDFGDGEQPDKNAIATHAYTHTGTYIAQFTIEDQVGNKKSDNVIVKVLTGPLVDSLQLPVNGDVTVGFAAPEGVQFVWHRVTADAGDTMLSSVLLGTNPLALDTIAKNIKGLSFTDSTVLMPATVYYWRVIVKNSLGWISSSVIDSFTTIKSLSTSKITISNIIADTTVKVADNVQFYGEAVDSGSTIAEYAWDFTGDGSYPYKNNTTGSYKYAYAKEGVYKAVFRVMDKNGKMAYDTVKITVTAVQPKLRLPVIANITADTNITAGTAITLSATMADTSSKIVKYQWDFNGDGNFDTTKLDNALCSHVYGAPGTYRAILLVTDSSDKKDTAMLKIIVTPVIPTDTPIIQSTTHDTTIKVLQPLLFTAKVKDTSDNVTLYSWKFGDGTTDSSGPLANSVVHSYSKEGNYNAVFVATDQNGLFAVDTVKVRVIKEKLVLGYASRDTVVDFGGTVRCSVSVSNTAANAFFEVDKAHNGTFVPMTKSGLGASFSFSTDTACLWDSVKMRVTSASTDTLIAGFKLDIRPRVLSITAIDSTDSTITVRWNQTKETDFKEYRLYSGAAASVDTLGSLVTTIMVASTDSFATPVPSRTRIPLYYRIYQKDIEGQLSAGSNVVFGNKKAPTLSQPTLITPSKDNDTLLSNATIRWNRSIDPAGGSVTYDLQLSDNTGSKPYVTGSADTFYTIKGLDTSSFRATVKVIASSSKSSSSFSQRLNVYFKQVASGRMRRVLAGTFSDDQNRTAKISHDYFMDTTEVTQLSFGTYFTLPQGNRANQQPVQNVTWLDAIMYCNALSKAEHLDTVYSYLSIASDAANGLSIDSSKKGYRLPSEDEWEMAAKGGRNYTYATDDGGIGCPKANYAGVSCRNFATVAVGTYPANPYGLHDLSGNISEWCWDIYNQNSAGRVSGRTDYTGPVLVNFSRFQYHSVRGGSFSDNTTVLQCSNRGNSLPTKYLNNDLSTIGFRCVRLAP